jgi:hypothetical protein
MNLPDPPAEIQIGPVTMSFEALADIAREVLSRNGWDVNTDDWFRHEKLEIDFRILPETEEFTMSNLRGENLHHLSVKEVIEFLESCNG